MVLRVFKPLWFDCIKIRSSQHVVSACLESSQVRKIWRQAGCIAWIPSNFSEVSFLVVHIWTQWNLQNAVYVPQKTNDIWEGIPEKSDNGNSASIWMFAKIYWNHKKISQAKLFITNKSIKYMAFKNLSYLMNYSYKLFSTNVSIYFVILFSLN